ncbi:hypothetical protein NLI96_g4020 [Meripilus lineatus]|uniref:F-box domain-containing protein n=1 Tax=Meripilus lineatus TaxID=2056292 RepID=A0AAD5VAL9_9APHY|nr:hypothetical protein NLI96_g4020 [Physisporinus lineatus]
MNLPHIPQELVSAILDFLSDDKLALSQSSLVSREWVLPSRILLFKSLQINDLHHLHSLGASEYISTHVRDISLTRWYDWGRSYRTPRELRLSDIFELLDCLPNLRSVTLCSANISAKSPNESSTLKRYSLKALSLEDCVIDTQSTLLQILGLFSSINNLTLIHPSFTSPLSDRDRQPRGSISQELGRFVPQPPTKISTLSVQLASWISGSMLDCLALDPPPYIANSISIEIPRIRGDTVASAVALLRTLGSKTTSLLLDFRKAITDGSSTDSLISSISFCPKIESLSLGLVLDSDLPETLTRSWQILFGIFDSLPSSTLTTLRQFRILWNIYGHDIKSRVYTQENWNELDMRLQRFQRLEKVEFRWEISQYYWQWLKDVGELKPEPFTIDTLVWGIGSETIKKLLPGVHARSLLVFSTADPVPH